MDVLLSVLGLVGFVAVTFTTAIFVAAEFSLTSLERSQIDNHVAEVGDRRAKVVQRAHRNLSFELSGAQLGITITTLITGYLSEPAIATLISPLLEDVGLPPGAAGGTASIIALIVATALSMTFGELVPKNLAIARPMGTARMVAGLQAGFSRIFSFFIGGLNGSANWIVRRLGIEPAEELRSARSPQELGSLVATSAQQGTLDEGTAEVMARSLRVSERRADELMTPRVRVEALSQDDTVDDLLAATVRTGFSRFPVVDRDLDDIKGVVHVKQAFSEPRARRATTKLRNLMRTATTVPDSLDGDELLDRLRGAGLQMALVVDEYGGTAGIVTLEDLVEEIVGDVRDEHDRGEAARVRDEGPDSWIVSGMLRPDELEDLVGWGFPENEVYETLAGYVVAELQRLANVGDAVTHDDWQLIVTRVDGRRISEVRVVRPPQVEPAAVTASGVEEGS
ncbi:hemolysin family protein [Actinomycetospora straminea]|uniref:Hemolysin family protein n=1 Tax=Actinomycetospora straminea TaxID=663607 RepID=A0ABP9DSH0_9PSEU|nr:hemolysin family protein [Actinomycetospora straminea]MDD7936273.1 hemolysin family protein [Actinomycetospora straminea]